MRPRPISAGGTAEIASVAFLMMLVKPWLISRRSNRAGIGSCLISASMSPHLSRGLPLALEEAKRRVRATETDFAGSEKVSIL